MDIEVEFLDMIRQNGFTPAVASIRSWEEPADEKTAQLLSQDRVAENAVGKVLGGAEHRLAVDVVVHLFHLDALLATVQMPSGIPVATVALNGAKNAAVLAAQILAVEDANLGGCGGRS